MYEKLFSEGRIGKVTLKNRLVMSPMGIGLANLDGSPSEDMICLLYTSLLERVNELYDLGLDIPEQRKVFQLSEKNRRLVIITVQGLKRVGGSLLPSYTEEEFSEATFGFVKYYVQSRHYDDLVKENKRLKWELDNQTEWRNRTDN